MFTMSSRNAALCHPSGQGTPQGMSLPGVGGPGTAHLRSHHRSVPSFMERPDKPRGPITEASGLPGMG